MDWLKRYQEGRRRALERHGINRAAPPPPSWPYDDPPTEPEWRDDPAPLPQDHPLEGGDVGSADRVAELEAQIAGLQGELSAAREAHENDDRLIAEARKMVEQYEAHTAGLEALAAETIAERDQLMDVLKIPGLKTLLAKQHFPDTHSKATEDEKRQLAGFAQKINAAYDLIKKDDRAKKSDEAA